MRPVRAEGRRDRSNDVRGAALMQQCRVCWIDTGGGGGAGRGGGQRRRIWCSDAARSHTMLLY